MKWEYVVWPQGFESWHAYWGKPTNKNKCELVVEKIGDKRYTIWWYDRGITDIKVHIDAENFEDAKEQAIKIVRNTLAKRANYWQAMLDGYNKWLDEVR